MSNLSKTQQSADDVGMTRETLSTDSSFVEIGQVSNLNKTQQSAADHATDFERLVHWLDEQDAFKGILAAVVAISGNPG